MAQMKLKVDLLEKKEAGFKKVVAGKGKLETRLGALGQQAAGTYVKLTALREENERLQRLLRLGEDNILLGAGGVVTPGSE